MSAHAHGDRSVRANSAWFWHWLRHIILWLYISSLNIADVTADFFHVGAIASTNGVDVGSRYPARAVRSGPAAFERAVR